MIQYVPLPVEWHPLSIEDESIASAVASKLELILEEWKDTPYDTKFTKKGEGTSCTGFICRVLCELYGKDFPGLPKLPNDVSFHSKKGSISGLKWFLRKFPAATKLEQKEVEPGDILITQPNYGGPGHAIIVGPRKNTMWQNLAGPVGVHYTGLYAPDSYQLNAVFRFSDREAWA